MTVKELIEELNAQLLQGVIYEDDMVTLDTYDSYTHSIKKKLNLETMKS